MRDGVGAVLLETMVSKRTYVEVDRGDSTSNPRPPTLTTHRSKGSAALGR
jgi:hypothetical protein